MQMQMLQIMEIKRKPVKKKYEVNLTKRDLAILEIANEMKFISLDDVYHKYFAVNLDQSLSCSTKWAYERLHQLEVAGLLKKTKSFHESKTYYQATKKGWRVVTNNNPGRVFSNYYKGFDLNTFHHDKTVLRARLYLESKSYATDWQSDRNLKYQTAVNEAGLRSYVPDGIYTNPDGIKVAFEIEISQKGRKCYQEKISKFIDHVEGRTAANKIFDVIHFVCERERVFEILCEETQFYKEHFKVSRLTEFFQGDYQIQKAPISKLGLW